MLALARGLLALALALSSVAGPATAQEVVGSVASVIEGARLERGGNAFGMSPEISLLSGDVIRTDATGTVQLLFRDDTRIVVGPNAVFVAADIDLRRNGRARRFAVNAFGGTFRFLSGNSADRSYDIRTPAATMGIRGTEFDFSVDRRTEATALVTHDGEVRFCGAARRCFDVSGGCATIRASRAGVDPTPLVSDAKTALLREQFPFTQSQESLQQRFRTRLAGCDDDDSNAAPVRIRAVVEAAVQTPRDDDNDRDSGPTGGSAGGGNDPGPRGR